ncbi:MAG: ferrous iron transport protein B [Christensenellales bacterium]
MNNATDVVFVGNPNVGKTTLFNKITNSFEHVGNWHGVTVEKKNKLLEYDGQKYNFVDLPGLYSTTSYSFEEQVSIDYLVSSKGIIVNVCDANVLERNLLLTLELLEFGANPILAINFSNEMKKRKISYNYQLLSKMLGCKVVVCEGNSKQGLISEFIQNKSQDVALPYLKKLPINDVISILTPSQLSILNNRKTYIATKLLEQDEFVEGKLQLSEEQKIRLSKITSKADYPVLIAKMRFEHIGQILDKCQEMEKETTYGKFAIDKIILNKYLCLPIFLGLMFLIFNLTFSSVGAWLSDLLKIFIDSFIGLPITNFLIKINAPNWVVGLFSQGIIGGVGGLLSFIPQIVLLFFFLSLLEDSGYMSRLAFSFEEIFHKFGLSGKSIFTVLMSFGCTTTAVLTSRNLEDKNAKIKTAMLSSYMSCSAKLPIYAVIGGAFFGKGNILIIAGLYLLGIVAGLVMASFFNKKILKSGEYSFVLEFPPYRFPDFRRIVSVIYQNCKMFVTKVATILLSFSIIVWIMQNFTFKFEYIPNGRSGRSMLEIIGEYLSYILRPIGLGNWGIAVSLLVGIMAKEMVVGTMAIINKVPTTTDFDKTLGSSFLASGFTIGFTPLTAVIMMIFSLLYMPCISTIAVMKKEIGRKWTFVSCITQFAVAYTICFVIYNLFSNKLLAQFIISFGVVFLIVSLFAWLRKRKTLGKIICSGSCTGCPNNCNR